jgi:hypothetical protein
MECVPLARRVAHTPVPDLVIAIPIEDPFHPYGPDAL